MAPNAASTYLFADGVHPTGAGHQLLANVVIANNTILRTTDDATTTGLNNAQGEGIFFTREGNSRFGAIGDPAELEKRQKEAEKVAAAEEAAGDVEDVVEDL